MGDALTLFLCGDVMTGRAIDQALPHACPPHLYEPYVRDARDYITLAEGANGPFPRPMRFEAIWGDALAELERVAPDVRLINLETSITTSEDAWPDKGIHYRMHPGNLPCLTAARIDCCALANNHVLDWGYAGLAETLATLRGAGLAFAGAGARLEEARAPVVLELPGKGRVLVFSFGTESSGIPPEWAASPKKAGVDFLEELSPAAARRIGERVRAFARPGATGCPTSSGSSPGPSSTRPEWTSSMATPPTTRAASKSTASGPSSMAAATSSMTMKASAGTSSSVAT
jgi:poly-gamma-glutamate capsule biosynthesis protein CapA/YwtB (metallophosphatase superfamily)